MPAAATHAIWMEWGSEVEEEMPAPIHSAFGISLGVPALPEETAWALPDHEENRSHRRTAGHILPAIEFLRQVYRKEFGAEGFFTRAARRAWSARHRSGVRRTP